MSTIGVCGCAIITFTLQDWLPSSATSRQIKCKLSPLKYHKHAKTVTTNLPMRWACQSKIIEESLSMIAAVSVYSSIWHPPKPNVRQSQSVSVYEGKERGGGGGGRGWSGEADFPPHHFSLPGINHPHPIMIKSVAQITWFYRGAGNRSFLQTSSAVNKSEISFGLQQGMSF